MLAPAYTETEKLLLDLADVVEKSTTYDQGVVWHSSCGTPGCAYGHLQEMRPETLRYCSHHYDEMAEALGISYSEFCELFNTHGCGNAGTDGRKAAAYLRDFVARKVRAKMEA